ncbi:MAG: phenylalanine--tRNA ligase subunit beta [Actinomycetota bacterium]
MKIPLSWLQSFATFPSDVALLTAMLDDLGLVVEGIERVGEGLEEVVCAHVLSIEPIEGADKIRKITVDAGGEPLVIVCGAWNFQEGDVVPLAPVGAVLPGGFAIAKRKMRGVSSHGMLCSAKELGVGDDQGGLLVLTDLVGSDPGVKLMELLGITADVVFDLSAEGNRPDAWSVLGVAKDLAARLSLQVTMPSFGAAASSGKPTTAAASASNAVPSQCSGLTVTTASGVVVGESPSLIAQRLSLSGMRPINNVVDASNYVMLELGQPTHAYDLEALSGPALGVRLARPGETLVTLDGVERTLGLAGRGLGQLPEDLVFVDGDDAVVGIAGVMGGGATEIHEKTSALLLEAACFDAMAIARTSKKLGLRSEASNRFERGVDPQLAGTATARFFEILSLTCPELTVDEPSLTAAGASTPRTIIRATPARYASLLGVDLDGETIATLLGPLGFAVERDGEFLDITVPTNRPDIRSMPLGIADVAEEIVRTYGYARLERRFPSWPAPGGLSQSQRLRRHLRAVLVGLGLDEVWTPTLVPESDAHSLDLAEPLVTLANPLAEQERALRSSLLPGMLTALRYNADRRQAEARFFEIGTAFTHPDVAIAPRSAKAGAGGGAATALPQESTHLVVTLRDDDDATTAVALWWAVHEALKLEDAELVQPIDESLVPANLIVGHHPTRSALIRSRTTGAIYGLVGEVDAPVLEAFGVERGSRVGLLVLDVTLLETSGLVPRRTLRATPVSRYPSSDIDLAFTLENLTPAGRLQEALVAAAGELCTSVTLFDVYRGKGLPEDRRSLAYSLRFEAQDRILTDDEVGTLRAACIAAAEQLGAVLR